MEGDDSPAPHFVVSELMAAFPARLNRASCRRSEKMNES
jgi:hypothetical protein